MVMVMKNDAGAFDYIFLMIQLLWGYTRLWVYWFFQFSSREWRRWRSGAYAARVQITKKPAYSLPPLLPFSAFAPPLRPLTPRIHHPLSPPSSLLYCCHSSSSLSLCPPSRCSSRSLPCLSLCLSSPFCPLQRPSLARQGWLQICSSVPWG